MNGVLTKARRLLTQYPLLRGMAAYAVIWPCSSYAQEYIHHGTPIKEADFARAARYSIFGSIFMSPLLYNWLKYSSRFFPENTLKTAITRAAMEQATFSPFVIVYFFFGMSLFEGKPVKECVNEVKEKFWPTYRVGVVFWPVVKTLTFYFVSERNRILFISVASFVWTVYIAHVKSMEKTGAKVVETVKK